MGSEDRVATGVEGFDDLMEGGLPRGAWLPGGDNGIHVVGFESHDSYSAYLSLGPMHSLPSESKGSSR